MKNEVIAKNLLKIDLFSNLSYEEIENISLFFKVRKYHKREIIYACDEIANQFLIVISGKIKIYRLSEQGRETIIRILEANEFTGELALFENVRKAYAEAIEDSELYVIEHKDFKQLLINYPLVAQRMIEILAYRLHLVEEQTSNVSTITAKDRLFKYLNNEAKIVKDKKIVHFSETKRVIAAYLGMSSETLSRMLHQLEVENKIKQHSDQHIEII